MWIPRSRFIISNFLLSFYSLALLFDDFDVVKTFSSKRKWKFDMKRDHGIYLRDADDTKRGVLILNPDTGAFDVHLEKVIETTIFIHSIHKVYEEQLCIL